MKLASVAVLTAVLVGLAPVPAQALAPRATLEAQLLARVNEARDDGGIAKLRGRSDLSRVARSWSAHMEDIEDLVLHPNIRRACRKVTRAIHTVAFDETVDAMFATLMANRPARAALMSRRYDRIGVGVVPNDEGDAFFATLIYAKQA